MTYISLIARALLLAATITITIGSLMPSSGISVSASDKVLHLVGYCGLAFLIGLSFPKWPLWKVILLAGLYGVILEFAQGLMSAGRSASTLDALANFAGAIIGAVLARAVRYILKIIFKKYV